jgi:hypothetical protein
MGCLKLHISKNHEPLLGVVGKNSTVSKLRVEKSFDTEKNRVKVYPFGMTKPNGRNKAGAGYRYLGINGQEIDDEVHESSNTAEFWQYDSRSGRRWNIDPRPVAGLSPYSTFANNPISMTDVQGDTTSFVNDVTGDVHMVDDGFENTTISVDENLFNRIKNEGFTKPVEHFVYGRNKQVDVRWNNKTYAKLLFEAVGKDISKNNSTEIFQSYENTYGRKFFRTGVNATYSDSDVQNSRLSPSAKTASKYFSGVNFASKLVLWRDDILRDNGLSNANQHQIASSILSHNSMAVGAFLITTGNEVVNLNMDRGTGNLKEALSGQPANDGGTTAFEWSDIKNNAIGIWKAWTGY